MPQAEARCRSQGCDWFGVAPDRTIIPRSEAHVKERNHSVWLRLQPGTKGIIMSQTQKTHDLGRLGKTTYSEIVLDGEPDEIARLASLKGGASERATESAVRAASAERLKCPECEYRTAEGRELRAASDMAAHRRIAHAARVNLKCPSGGCEFWVLRMNAVKARQKLRRHIHEVHGLPWAEAEGQANAVEPVEEVKAIPIEERSPPEKEPAVVDDDGDDDVYLSEPIAYRFPITERPAKCSGCGGDLRSKALDPGDGEEAAMLPSIQWRDVLYVFCCIGCYSHAADLIESRGGEVR